MDRARLRFPLLALVAPALLVALWTPLRGSERPTGAPGVAVAAPQRVSPAFVVTSSPAPTPLEAAVEALLPVPMAPDSSLRLLVLREGDEAPLAGVSTCLTTADGEQRARTDASGLVTLAVPPGPIDVEVAETASTRIAYARFDAAGDQRLVVPHRGGQVTGHVVDQDGEPVQGAEVLFWGAHAGDAVDWDHPAHTALTDAEGAFALQDTAGRYGDSMDFAIAARRSDRASLFALASWTSEHVDVHGARLVLGDALPISGRVRSATGAPVRARVLAQADCGAYLAWCEIHPAPRPGGAWLQRDAGCAVEPLRLVLNTDDDGRFLLPGLADRWTFIVWADGLPTLHAERDAAADGSPIEIALLAPVALYGSLRDAAGAPVRGARVTYRAAHGHGTVESDDSGAWRLQGVSPALTRLTISCPGYATLCEDLDLALTPRGPHDVVLQPSLALTGMVLDERGSLLTRALVTMAWDGPAGSSSSSTGEIRRRRLLDDDLCSTQERGTFRFDSLAAGRYRVQLIDRQTDSVLGATLANAGESGVCLVQGQGLDLITRVRGRVIDAAGQSRRDVVIDVQAFSDASAQDLVLQSHCSPDEADCFALPDMAPGWLRVTVWPQPEEGMPAPAWTRSRGEPLLTWGPHQVAGGTQQLDLRLDR